MHPPSPVALITGSGKGIGREAARLLAAAESLLLQLDVSDPAAATSAVTRTAARFGRLDAVVHCAGVAPQLPLEQTTLDDWHNVINTNLSSAFYLAKAAWPHFKQQGGGIIVNISSEAARDPFPSFAAYGAAKAGLNLLGRSLAKEGAPHNIRVHTLAPAAVETQMFRNLVTRDQWPAEKTLSPTDVAEAILSCLTGPLRHTSGDVVWLHKTI